MKFGDRGLHVVKVQNALNLKGANPKLIADGVFGNATLNAVKAFQALKLMTITGIVDNALAVKLGLYPSDIVAPVISTSVTTYSPASPFSVQPVGSKFEKFYTIMGGKTMALAGVAVLMAATALTFFSKDKKPKEDK